MPLPGPSGSRNLVQSLTERKTATVTEIPRARLDLPVSAMHTVCIPHGSRRRCYTQTVWQKTKNKNSKHTKLVYPAKKTKQNKTTTNKDRDHMKHACLSPRPQCLVKIRSRRVNPPLWVRGNEEGLRGSALVVSSNEVRGVRCRNYTGLACRVPPNLNPKGKREKRIGGGGAKGQSSRM